MTYNATASSQTVSKDYLQSFPMESQKLLNEGAKGDFTSLVSREEDSHLAALFNYHWLNNRSDHQIKPSSSEDKNQSTQTKDLLKLRVFELPADEISNKFPNASSLGKHASFLRSDHVRFWIANHQDYYASFHSIHISDTGPARGIMKECYHNACDDAAYNLTKVTFASLDMLEKVTQTTIDLLLDVSNAKCARTRPFQSEFSRVKREFNFWDKRYNTALKGSDPFEQPPKEDDIVIKTVETREDQNSVKEMPITRPFYYSQKVPPHWDQAF